MATTQLADVYVPVPFRHAADEAAIELNAFLASGILQTDPVITAMASTGGVTGDLPFWKPLGAPEPNYVNDDPGTLSVPQKIGSGLQRYRKANMHQSWSTMDLTRELALDDPLTAIARKVGKYWAIQIEKRVIETSMGILADNVANDTGDMVYSIATDDVGAITAAERISAEAVIACKQTMGDHADALSVIAMHSVVYSELQRQNLIAFIPNARGEVNIPTYLGYRVVMDDSMSAVSGTNRITYTTILFSAGAFAYAAGNPTTPSELERIPGAGNGGGQDVLHSRRTDIIHPSGADWLDASVAGQSATLAELASDLNWDRVVERKNVPIAFLQTNG